MLTIRNLFKSRTHLRPKRSPSKRSRLPELESLESRVVLYSAAGNAWLNPAVVTISFMPDGTDLGGVASNLQSTFNNNPLLAGRWQTEIIKAAQSWAQKTNINFVVVPDNGQPSASGNYQEGNPNYGDIRIGGYNFGSSTLGLTFEPPPINNFSIAGDVTLNTAQPFNVGTTFDLYTVSMHEIGHALGLGNTAANSTNVMYPTYVGKKIVLGTDDIAGIRSLYSGGGTRSLDAYNATASNGSIATASNISSQINAVSKTALVPNLDITNAGQVENFAFVAPVGASTTLKVSAQSSGLSLLSPKLTVFAADGVTVLGSATGAGLYGTTVSVTVPGYVAGQTYYARVQGADTTVMGTGKYALGLSFNGSVPPQQASPIIAFPNGTPISSGGGEANYAEDNNFLGAIPVVKGISPDTGASNSDNVTNANRVSVVGTAHQGDTIAVYVNAALLGTTTTDAEGNWSFDNTGETLADGNYILTASATDPDGNVSDLSGRTMVTIKTDAPATPLIVGITSYTSISPSAGVTSVSTPTMFGTASPYSTVTLTSAGQVLGSAAANAIGAWNFTFAPLDLGDWSITASASDVAGNTSAASATFTVTEVAFDPGAEATGSTPAVTGAWIAASSALGTSGNGAFTVTGETPEFHGTATPNALVTVLEDDVIVGVISADSVGIWVFVSPTLTAGTHRIAFEAFDEFGNVVSTTNPILIQVE